MIHITEDTISEIVGKRIFLYGAGSTGKTLCKILLINNVYISGYIDDDPAKVGGGD